MELIFDYGGHGFAIRRNCAFAYRNNLSVAIIRFLDSVTDALQRHCGGAGISNVRHLLAVELRVIRLPGRRRHAQRVAGRLVGE